MLLQPALLRVDFRRDRLLRPARASPRRWLRRLHDKSNSVHHLGPESVVFDCATLAEFLFARSSGVRVVLGSRTPARRGSSVFYIDFPGTPGGC